MADGAGGLVWGVIRWLLFGGAPLLAALWIAASAARVSEEDRLRAAGSAAATGCAALLILYGAAGALYLGVLLLLVLRS